MGFWHPHLLVIAFLSAFASKCGTSALQTPAKAMEEAREGSPNPGAEETRGRRRRRWGAETEAGKQVLEEVAKEAAPTPEGQQSGQPRRKKSRWEAQEEVKAVVPGMPLAIALPPSLAHLIDFNPESLELNRQLNIVSGPGLVIFRGVVWARSLFSLLFYCWNFVQPSLPLPCR